MTPQAPITGDEVADVLERAADKIERPNGWTQGTYADVEPGAEYPVEPTDGRATCFCIQGAVANITGGFVAPLYGKAMRFVEAVVPPPTTYVNPVVAFNDAPERTQAEVVAALRSAATAARQQGVGK